MVGHTMSASASDHALVGAWRRGDKRAGAALLARHDADVRLFFRNRVRPLDCEDLVQATFLGLIEGLDRFRGEASFRTWLFAIAHNKYQRYLRDRYRYQRRFDYDHEVLAEPFLPLIQALVRHEQSAQLLEAVRCLPPDTQMILELYYWQNLKMKEIAGVMAMPVATVKLRIHRGRVQVRDKLCATQESTSPGDRRSPWPARRRRSPTPARRE